MVTDLYDVIVIGGGSAGLSASAVAAGLGKRTALVERENLGGDCTWTGCVPSKALLKVGKVAQTVRSAGKYGVHAQPPQIDMPTVRAYIDSAIHELYQHETPEVFGKRGMDVILGDARFLDPHSVQVGERTLHSKRFIIATGGRALIPAIPGLTGVRYMTNATIFRNDTLPRHLIVLGAGPIGMEIGQAYRRLGAEVTIIGEQVLPRDEPEAGKVMAQVFADEGVTLIASRVTYAQHDDDCIRLTLGDGRVVEGDMLLVAAGRTPNVEGLGLEMAGVQVEAAGIPVRASLQTNVPHIYAIGDVTTGPKFTHYAGFQGLIAGRNAVLPIKSNGLPKHVPWVTFTDPEIAHVGMTEAQARAEYGAGVKTFMFSTKEGDRTVVEDDTRGFVKLVYRGGGDLLGATVVSERAGEMITGYGLVIDKKISLRALTGTMHAYPTYADVAKQAAFRMSVAELLGSWFAPIAKKVVKLLP
jgi:pyruvate/2-oxoglutarate dehydrogenase complex dihydrolipoamide dehydrogenase (E3) component